MHAAWFTLNTNVLLDYITCVFLPDFTNLLRTGGEIGPDHLFDPLAVSENGLTAMHAYLQSPE